MSEAEAAWHLWHLLQQFSDTLWNHYESAFMDFCGEENAGNGYIGKGIDTNEELPF